MIYIHIPFCRSLCGYCDFYHSGSLLLLDDVVGAIKLEALSRRDYLDSVPRTLYFGGGTPSVLSVDQVAMLVDYMSDLWGVDSFDEVTFEANPDDITVDYVGGLRAAGVDRLSLGVQSFDDEHLRLMNRRHTGREAVRAVERAQAAGFDNITIDLIYAMPFLTDHQWQRNLDQAVDLGVQHVSGYHLTIERRTLFGKQGMQAVDDDVSERHFAMLRRSLIAAGFEHYEVSNFAAPGRRAIHNSGYWQGLHYIGLGPSAHSFNGKQRSWNPPSNRLYLKKTTPEVEILTTTDIYNERLMTRLRTADGLMNPDEELLVRARKFLDSGTLIIENNCLRIPPHKFLMSDFIISKLFI